MTTLPHHAVHFLGYFFFLLCCYFFWFLFDFFSVAIPAFFDFVISRRFILIKRKFVELWPSQLTIKRGWWEKKQWNAEMNGKPDQTLGLCSWLLESFRFADENDYEYEIWFKVFSRIVKRWTRRILHCTFFTRKVSTVIVIGGGWAFSRLQNAKTSNSW